MQRRLTPPPLHTASHERDDRLLQVAHARPYQADRFLHSIREEVSASSAPKRVARCLLHFATANRLLFLWHDALERWWLRQSFWVVSPHPETRKHHVAAVWKFRYGTESWLTFDRFLRFLEVRPLKATGGPKTEDAKRNSDLQMMIRCVDTPKSLKAHLLSYSWSERILTIIDTNYQYVPWLRISLEECEIRTVTTHALVLIKARIDKSSKVRLKNCTSNFSMFRYTCSTKQELKSTWIWILSNYVFESDYTHSVKLWEDT